jgi:GNAT superfamily N-acetyltransferase
MSDTVNYGLLEVDWNDPRAIAMRDAMDAEIQPRYAGRAVDPEASARALAVNPDDIVLTVLAIDPDGRPVGHAALRRLGPDLEVKRVVVLADARGHGLARRLMAYLENFAEARGARRLILQTGDRQPDAVALYRSLGYQPIAIYQPYTDAIPFSMCFEKLLAPS